MSLARTNSASWKGKDKIEFRGKQNYIWDLSWKAIDLSIVIQAESCMLVGTDYQIIRFGDVIMELSWAAQCWG